MASIGYGRVSKRDQNPDSQRDLLTAAGCEVLFLDRASGKLASRPELYAAMKHLRAGDVLVITRLDRLGRSVKHLAALAVELQERRIGLRVLQQGIDTTTAVGRLFFHILAAIAEFERELIVERTVDGLDASRARGRAGGRKPTLTPAAVRQVQAMYDSGTHTVEEIAKAFKTTRPTIYRALATDSIGKRPRASAPAPPDAAGSADPAAALAAILDRLPADARPQPSVEHYDDLLTSRATLASAPPDAAEPPPRSKAALAAVPAVYASS